MKEHTARVTGMRVFDDDAHLLTCSRDKSFLCWDLRREKRVASYIQRMGGLNDAVLANDQATVLTVGSEKKVTYWDLRQPEPVRAIEYARDHEATTIAFSHDNRFFVTGGTDQAVRLWDFRTGRPMNEGLGHSGTVSRVRFSPDDRQVVSVGADGCIFVWNVFDN
jgi:WD40 repeat protein